jgi:hypothetical protein
VSELMLWTRVPDGSRLELRVATGTGKCVANAEWVVHTPDDSETTELWTDAELSPGPKKSRLRSPNDYAGFLRVTFPIKDPSQAMVTAQIIKPDGTNYGPVKSETVSGRKGDDPRLVTIIIRTLKS